MNEQSGTLETGEYLTKPEVAKLFQVTPRCIDKWMAAGLVPYFKIGGAVRFSRPLIEAHLATNHRRN